MTSRCPVRQRPAVRGLVVPVGGLGQGVLHGDERTEQGAARTGRAGDPARGEPPGRALPGRRGGPAPPLRAARLRRGGRGHPFGQRVPRLGRQPLPRGPLARHQKVKDLLEHLFVLLPVLDDDKHYWVGNDEVDKLLRRGGAWLGTHPERELIANRYLRHDAADPRSAGPPAGGRRRRPRRGGRDAATPRKRRSNARSASTSSASPRSIDAVSASGARRVLDLGCGQGKLTGALLKLSSIDHVVGLDVSHRSLEIAARRLHLDTMAPRQRAAGRAAPRVAHLPRPPSRGVRSRGHRRSHRASRPVPPGQLRASACSRTPSRRTSSSRRPTSSTTCASRRCRPARLRHRDHRFEWTRAEFESWADGVARRHGYEVRLSGIGPADDEVGPPTQMAVFTR